MLIITRKPGESVIINDKEIIVTVLKVDGNHVRIGFEAAEDISINREEIYTQIKNGKSETTGERICTIGKSKLLTSPQK